MLAVTLQTKRMVADRYRRVLDPAPHGPAPPNTCTWTPIARAVQMLLDGVHIATAVDPWHTLEPEGHPDAVIAVEVRAPQG